MGSFDTNLNPRHPMFGKDAYLVVEYNCFVEGDPNPFHPCPHIKNQAVKFHILPEKRNEINATGAQNIPHDGIIQILVVIDGEPAISISDVRSGWSKWIYVFYSFGIKCDNSTHKIGIQVKQWISEIAGLSGRWREIFRQEETVKFEKISGEEKHERIVKEKKGAIAKIRDRIIPPSKKQCGAR